MPKVLVTGGSGFIGGHAAKALADAGFEIAVLDLVEPSFGTVDFIEGSVADARAVERAVRGCDFIVHFAALVGVQESFDKPVETITINEIGTANVLEAARKANVKKVVFASTAAVYGSESNGAVSEETVPKPLSVYASTKLCGEFLCKSYKEKYGLDFVAFRFFNVFGPDQKQGAYAAVVPRFINAALKGDDIVIYGDGKQTRDFVFVRDVAAACVKALQGNACGVFNVGSGKSVSVVDLANRVIALSKSKSKLVFKPGLKGEVLYSLADVSKAGRELNWSPAHALEKGLEETIESFGKG